MLDYSIVIPVYNEEESLEQMWVELRLTMLKLNRPYELIFVDDCSSDRTPQILKEFKKEAPNEIVVLSLPSRSGQSCAMKQGVNAVRGRIVFTLDADLQNDPADIPLLLDKMEEGYDVVCGWRKARKDKPVKMAFSKFGNVLQRSFTGMTVHDISCTLRAYKKDCLKDIGLNWEGQHRFIPLVLSRKGYKVSEVISNHRERRFGVSKYNHRRLLKVVVHFLKIMFS